MKTLKFIGIAIIAVLMCVNFASCNSEDVSNETNDEIIVNLNLDGEFIEYSEYPLSRNTETPAIQIQIEQYNVNTEEYEPYAYGTFDDISKISAKLNKNYKYNFIVCLYYDYIEKYIFSLFDTPKVDIGIINKFEYSNKYLHISRPGYAMSPVDRSTLNYADNMIPCKSFHGRLEDYEPDGNDISIDMKNTTIGLEVIVEGMTEGKIENRKKTMGSIPFSIEYPATTYSTLRTSYCDVWVQEYVPVHLNIYYINTNGDEVAIVDEQISVKRNHKKVVTIKLEKINSNEVNSNLSLNLEDDEMGNDTEAEYTGQIN